MTFGDLSIGLFFQLWVISSSCQRIENLYQTKFTQFPLYIVDDLTIEQLDILRQLIERIKSIDFLYFTLQISVTIVACASILYYKMSMVLPQLGLILIQVFQYYDSKLTPLEMVNFFGFQFRNMYHPYVLAVVNLLMTSFASGQNSTPNQNGNGTTLWSISSIFNNPTIWFYIISFGLGHLWWCSREMILGSVHYNDEGDATSLDDAERSRRIKKREILKENGVWKFDFVKEALVILMLPPWYWIMLSKIKQHRPIRRQRRVPIEEEDLREEIEQNGEHIEEQEREEEIEQIQEEGRREEEQAIRHLNEAD